MTAADCTLSGPWSWPEVDVFLTDTTVPLRLATNGADGWPAVMPLWFRWHDRRLWLAMPPTAGMVRRLQRDGRCAFDISIETMPYKGIRGRGMAEVLNDGLPMLERLLDRYVGNDAPGFRQWLLARSQDECAIRIQPHRLVSWDFGQRMQR